ncbi:hypothetical protein ACFL1L_04915 [Thermoplasmatota archaeon]
MKNKNLKNDSSLSDIIPSGLNISSNGSSGKCTRCGYAIQENWFLCPICGQKLKNQDISNL